MNSSPDSIRSHLLLALPLVVLLLTYSNSFEGAFLQDDYDTLINNRTLDEYLGSWTNILTSRLNSRGLTMWTFSLNKYLLGETATSYHVGNLLIHILTTYAVWMVLHRLIQLVASRRNQLWQTWPAAVPLFATLIFAVHPIQTQAVTYLSQRSEALMGLFMMLTLLTLLEGARQPGTWQGTLFLFSSILLCGLGMRAKEAMIVAPVLLFWCDRAMLANSWGEMIHRRGWYHLLIWLTLLLNPSWDQLQIPQQISGLLASETTSAIPETGNSVTSSSEDENNLLTQQGTPFDRWQYLKIQPGVVLTYTCQLFVPNQLCFDRGHVHQPETAELVLTVAFWTIPVVATLVAVFLWPEWGFLGGWFFVNLAPRSSIIPLVNGYFEYRMYLPLLAIAVLMGLLLERIFTCFCRRESQKVLARAAVYPIFIVLLMNATYSRNTIYSDPVLLWQDTVDKAPLNSRAWTNLCRSHIVAGGKDHIRKAVEAGRRATEINPNYAKAFSMYALALQRAGEEAQAIQMYERSLELKPGQMQTYLNLGILYHATDPAKALDYYQQAMTISPDDPVVRINLATLQLFLHAPDPAAEKMLQDVTREYPDNIESRRNLALHYLKHKQNEDAFYWAEEALKVSPADEQSLKVRQQVLQRISEENSTRE
ncbi:MAG: tetratricopeptide repeat protein [Planctomycetaceae bacterium]|nr:tetratricopeptide repeat protein [Planctomycetaceae bacterium]